MWWREIWKDCQLVEYGMSTSVNENIISCNLILRCVALSGQQYSTLTKMISSTTGVTFIRLNSRAREPLV